MQPHVSDSFTDLVFKTMLENNLAALKSLITAVLQPESPIDFIKILSPEPTARRLSALSASQLGALLDAAIDFQSTSYLEHCLKQNS